MSLREIFNAISGFSELKRQEFSVLFDMAKYNASRTAFSEEQQKQINKDKNPFTERKVKQEDMSFDDMLPMLKSISKRKN